ncbi:high mobility group nucleosome-binding domain-containing protein 5-like [Diachasma alloeum]|uniref:high mobility group nucleosome-binding domain-containing protein 5-like n=1 Tax=Diachasma alloeum TaxID=454923 RepID=UPI0007384E50|nr:high mobility group nucleosome-binding domain-containing protein 5-like [Diachasma alloeum]
MARELAGYRVRNDKLLAANKLLLQQKNESADQKSLRGLLQDIAKDVKVVIDKIDCIGLVNSMKWQKEKQYTVTEENIRDKLRRITNAARTAQRQLLEAPGQPIPPYLTEPENLRKRRLLKSGGGGDDTTDGEVDVEPSPKKIRTEKASDQSSSTAASIIVTKKSASKDPKGTPAVGRASNVKDISNESKKIPLGKGSKDKQEGGMNAAKLGENSGGRNDHTSSAVIQIAGQGFNGDNEEFLVDSLSEAEEASGVNGENYEVEKEGNEGDHDEDKEDEESEKEDGKKDEEQANQEEVDEPEGTQEDDDDDKKGGEEEDEVDGKVDEGE